VAVRCLYETIVENMRAESNEGTKACISLSYQRLVETCLTLLGASPVLSPLSQTLAKLRRLRRS